MVVWLEAVTEKVAVPNKMIVWLTGWEVITGGGPICAWLGVTNQLNRNRQAAVFLSRLLKPEPTIIQNCHISRQTGWQLSRNGPLLGPLA